jgi:deoxyinosine 3'endonuclease (endonuclease V)
MRMADANALRDLRKKELITLRERVETRIKLKPAPKRIRRIAGVDLVLTPGAGKVHVCASLMSYPKLTVLEEAIATDELDTAVHAELGTVAFVPLILSVLKMLKQKCDLIMVKELSAKEDIPLAGYIGVISGRPTLGISDKSSTMKATAKLEGIKRAGPVKIRGHKTPLGVVAGHLVTFTDSWKLVKGCITDSRIPEPIRNARSRVRAWEREWRRLNLGRK